MQYVKNHCTPLIAKVVSCQGRTCVKPRWSFLIPCIILLHSGDGSGVDTGMVAWFVINRLGWLGWGSRSNTPGEPGAQANRITCDQHWSTLINHHGVIRFYHGFMMVLWWFYHGFMTHWSFQIYGFKARYFPARPFRSGAEFRILLWGHPVVRLFHAHR